MKEALVKLKQQINRMHPPEKLTDAQWNDFSQRCTVVLMAGGESSRFAVGGQPEANKNAFRLPNGDTMLEMAVRMYKDAGIRDFTVLVYHKAQSIQEVLGDGSKLGITVRYSYDPDKPVGKGGAVKNALENGSLSKDRYFIIHNPDDVIVNFPISFPRYIVAGHMEGEKEGSIATVVVADETPYAYTGMQILDNRVEMIEMYPMIPVPTHIGVTIFSPSAADYFYRLFDYSEKQDFEKMMFPLLAEEKKLHAVGIPHDNWIAVNNPKAYKQLLKTLGLEEK